jgi:hypothetical protein
LVYRPVIVDRFFFFLLVAQTWDNATARIPHQFFITGIYPPMVEMPV